MINYFKALYSRYFSQEEAVVVVLVMAFAVLILWGLGSILIPVFAALIIAYLCIPPIDWLKRKKVPELLAVIIVFLCFLLTLFLILITLLPALFTQTRDFLIELPNMSVQLQTQLLVLSAQYPDILDATVINEWFNDSGSFNLNSVEEWLPQVLSFSIATLPNLLNAMIYLVIVPILVFFMLKDRILLWNKFVNSLPDKRTVLNAIGVEMNQQIANYIRGKMVEIIIVAGATYIGFTIIGVQYAELLSIAIGLSVLVPYIGAVVVTIPVMMAGFFQYGFGTDFYTMLAIYMGIQIIDGNVLVPLLFSEAVNLHPIFIILAVLVFGGLWGFWGVFFAIPLATLIKAVINAWPKVRELQSPKAE
jgi:putative permease